MKRLLAALLAACLLAGCATAEGGEAPPSANVVVETPVPQTPGPRPETPQPVSEAPRQDASTPTPAPATPTPAPATPTPAPATPTPAPATPTPALATPTPDAGTPTPDAGTPTPSAGTPTPGTGTPTPGAGTPAPDAGTPTPGAGTPTPDAGTPTPGAGTPAPDAGTPTPGPSVTPSATPGPGIPADAEAWMADPEDPTQIIAGKLEDLLKDFDANTEAVIYIRSGEVLRVKDKTPNDVVKTTFLPDETVFEKDKFIVRVSEYDPALPAPLNGEGTGEALEATPAPEVWLYIWVEEKPLEPTPSPTPKPGPIEMDIFVAAEAYVPNAWSCEAPTFTLSGMPEDARGYSYAVIAYDERFIILSGNSYTSRDEGEYSLRFAILDPIGDVCALSTRYDIKLDLTPPAYITASILAEGQPQFMLSSEDALSGLDAFSVDGGTTWVPAGEGGTYVHTGRLGEIYRQGMLMARDVAGNIIEYPTDFQIPEPIEYPSFGGGGGGGGGGGSGEPSINHTGDEDVDTTPYGELDLVLPEGPMHGLTIGETPLELTLELDSAEGLELDTEVPYMPMFTAALARWTEDGLKPWEPDAPEEGEDEAHAALEGPDTLVLTAVIDPAIEGGYAYIWHFNGLVYRLLFNSGVEYLVLQVGNHVAAFPTAGFTAGTAYTDLKAAGVSTRKFNYTIWMSGSTLDAMAGEMAVEATVDDEVYPMSGDETQPMYYYGLYYGPTALLDVPFGAWTPELAETIMQALEEEKP